MGRGWYERLVSYWLSWASVAGQSDTSAVGFTQFAGCQMKLIVLPSAGHSFFSSVSGRETSTIWVLSVEQSNSHSRTRRLPLTTSLIPGSTEMMISRHWRCEWKQSNGRSSISPDHLMNRINYAAAEWLQMSLKFERCDDIRQSWRWTNVFEGGYYIQKVELAKNHADWYALSLMWTATWLRRILLHRLVWQLLLLWQRLNSRLSTAACWSHKLRACLIYSTLTICSKQLLNDPP